MQCDWDSRYHIRNFKNSLISKFIARFQLANRVSTNIILAQRLLRLWRKLIYINCNNITAAYFSVCAVQCIRFDRTLVHYKTALYIPHRMDYSNVHLSCGFLRVWETLYRYMCKILSRIHAVSCEYSEYITMVFHMRTRVPSFELDDSNWNAILRRLIEMNLTSNELDVCCCRALYTP